MFGFGKKATDAVKKFSGRTDFLEAVCAASALIASADGTIDDGEIQACKKAIMANKALADGFDARTIETCIEKMLDRAGGGRVGRSGLWKEVEEGCKDPEQAEAIVLSALDVAEADGSIGDKEKAVLEQVANRAKVNLANLMVA